MEKAKLLVIEEFNSLAKSNSLAGFEKIKKVILIKESFLEKDLITATFKVRRKECDKSFAKEIRDLFKD